MDETAIGNFYIFFIFNISYTHTRLLRKARKRGYVPRIDRATPREFCKGGVKPGSQYVAQQCGVARCGVTQAPRRAFNCASVFTTSLISTCSNRLYWPSYVRRGAIRGRLSVQKLSQATRHAAPRSRATYCEPAKNEVGPGPAVHMLITQFYTCYIIRIRTLTIAGNSYLLCFILLVYNINIVYNVHDYRVAHSHNFFYAATMHEMCRSLKKFWGPCTHMNACARVLFPRTLGKCQLAFVSPFSAVYFPICARSFAEYSLYWSRCFPDPLLPTSSIVFLTTLVTCINSLAVHVTAVGSRDCLLSA